MDESEKLTPFERDLGAALKADPAVRTADCPEPETFLALAERTLPEADALSWMAHVALCARCRREYAETVELVGLANEVRALDARAARGEPFWRRWRAPALGFSLGATACAALMLAVLLPVRHQRDTLAATLRERERALASARKEAADLRRRGGDDRNRLEAQVRSQTVRIARLTRADAALAEASLPVPAWRMIRDEGGVRGGADPADTPPQLALDGPVDTAIESARPHLACRAVPGAADYHAQLERADTEGDAPVLRAVGPTRWEPATPLAPGVYRWAVTARRGESELRSPTARFAVLDASQRRELASARRRYTGNPLALAAVTARLGLDDETRRQLDRVLKADPNHPTARRWRDALRARS